MTDWTAGYMADITYTYGYYAELNPQRIKLAFLQAGLAFPEVKTACELGFGQGVTVAMHAAASPVQWYGTDFNPAQVAFAQELVRNSGTDAKLYDDSFVEFAKRNDLPDFDYICLHGIWSWVSDENRQTIIDFVRRKLKVGGVLSISYNTQPGWASFIPLRNLMSQYTQTMGVKGDGVVRGVGNAFQFVSKLLATQPKFLRDNPQIADRMVSLAKQNPVYLAHEFFNGHWQPMDFATIAKWMDAAKVQFACSATFTDQIDAIHLTQEQVNFLRGISDSVMRESVRDFMVNRQFRRDYWVKGARKLSDLEKQRQFMAQKILLVTHRPDVTLTMSGSLGEGGLSQDTYGPLLDALADHTVKTVGQLCAELTANKISPLQVQQGVQLLVDLGFVSVVQDDAYVSAKLKESTALNDHIKQQAMENQEIGYLVSPVSGGGFGVNRFQQLFLLCLAQGKNQPAEWAQFAWQVVSAQGQKLVKNGKPIDTAEENIAELTAQATTFAQKQLPILKALQIA